MTVSEFLAITFLGIFPLLLAIVVGKE